jgi:hypothetical protein
MNNKNDTFGRFYTSYAFRLVEQKLFVTMALLVQQQLSSFVAVFSHPSN